MTHRVLVFLSFVHLHCDLSLLAKALGFLGGFLDISRVRVSTLRRQGVRVWISPKLYSAKVIMNRRMLAKEACWC